jgi:hypothetical protein
VNCPSMEASDLTTAGKFVPHTTAPEKKKKKGRKEVWKGGRRDRDRKRGEIGGLWKNIHSDG